MARSGGEEDRRVVAVRRLVEAALLVALALSARAQCNCHSEPIKWEYKHTDEVFIGTVLEVREYGTEADLRVDRSFKGTTTPGATVTIWMRDGTDSCRKVPLNGTWLVMLDADSWRGMQIVSCSHSGDVEEPDVKRAIALIEHRHQWWNKRLSSISFHPLGEWWRWRRAYGRGMVRPHARACTRRDTAHGRQTSS
jgi:hypothetical protein